MPPHQDGSFIIGRYLENRHEVTPGSTYIFLTVNDGITYKRVQGKGENSLTLQSDNKFYEPYDIQHSNILEIWEYASSIATQPFESDDLTPETVGGMFRELKKEIVNLKLVLK